MNRSKDNFSTPKQTKRLGLRRNNSVLKKSSSQVEAFVVETKLNHGQETPVSRLTGQTTQSDRKVNYKNLEEKAKKLTESVTNTPQTPKDQTEELLTRQSVSTNCRPYRLSLSKRIREKMTKKRLEFHLANEIDKDQLDVKDTTQLSKEELLAQIEMARKELIARQEHVKKVEELQKTINVWQQGFSTALQDLQQKIEPHLELPQLLERLKIPQEMLKYIED